MLTFCHLEHKVCINGLLFRLGTFIWMQITYSASFKFEKKRVDIHTAWRQSYFIFTYLKSETLQILFS